MVYIFIVYKYFDNFGGLKKYKQKNILNKVCCGVRAVECAGLENRCSRKGTEGSNPSCSANLKNLI